MTPEQVNQLDEAVGIGVIIGFSIFYLVIYVFFAYCMARIAVKLNREFGKSFVLMLIPIVNIFYLLKLAQKPLWWFILLIIPLVNIVFSILMWMSICEQLGKPGWWGVLMLIPVVNFVILIILAFEKPRGVTAPA